MNLGMRLSILPILRSVLCTTCALASGTQAGAPQESTEQVVKKSSDAVVLIYLLDSVGKETGLGSGFIVSPEGKIVTNYHVIKDVQKALVKLSNGAFFPVESILAINQQQDLALIKVAGKNLPTVSISNSNGLQVGERVVAIGSPLGLESTVSDGIVSAIREESRDVSWIQTTAPASPGNSGGPLLRMDGKVVGVITWNIRTGQNLNFAATSNEVSALIDEADKVKPLVGETSVASLIPSEQVWTSLVSGKDYKIRVDGGYLYTEWTDLPASLKDTSAFTRGELKKSGTGWKGQYRSYFPCVYIDRWGNQQIKNWITMVLPIEITMMTATRIEGRAQNYEQGIDCKKATPKGQPTWASFTWIPKD
jgi:S1-C subfamily serine protease